MEPLPKIVLSGLQAAELSHPEPDLLTAFMERRLLPQERTQILDHLARCTDCREIVSLCTDTDIESAAAFKIRPASSWRPLFAWGGVAACLVIIASVFVLHKHPSGAMQIAQRENPVILVQHTSNSEVQQQLQPEMKSEAKDTGTRKKDADRAAFGNRDSAVPSLAKSLNAGRNLPPQQAPAVAGELTSTMQVDTNKVNNSSPAQASPSSRESFAAASTDSIVGKIKDDHYPHWTLDSDGTLMRLLNTGAAWQKIVIPGNAATLRAIATVGPHVWIGGDGGAVYHSADAGGHWERVTPAAKGGLLTDDVIGMEFMTEQKGKLTTVNHETWSTQDGGLTWSKD
jgi:hypothetical protein